MSDAFFGEPPRARRPTPRKPARSTTAGAVRGESVACVLSRQLEIRHERQRFHWITNRALRGLVNDGLIRSEEWQLRYGHVVNLMWHRSYRYYRRAAAQVVALIEEYAAPDIGTAIGLNGEHLVLEGIARHRFVVGGREARMYDGTIWTATSHDLHEYVVAGDPRRARGLGARSQTGAERSRRNDAAPKPDRHPTR